MCIVGDLIKWWTKFQRLLETAACKYMQAFISHEGSRSLTAGVSFAERRSLSNTISLCRVGRRLTTRSQTIVIVLDFVLSWTQLQQFADGQIEKCANAKIYMRNCSLDNLIKIMTISGGQISRLENAKPSKFGTPSRIFLDYPGGRAKSIEAMRFIYEQGKHHKKKSWPRKSLLLPSSDSAVPHRRPLLLS